ncbi:Predicted Zn-dependent peptidase [Geosporobacter subterraneus DSM 17957]|uniref:Predicted Zn-dependent peptidase n=1 Tax=Geosporobacter subterraneus DSM 17957 TaxID=1121919 RepID=A0A1M6E028_9FIRM|nr:pitrilysin family protein [Geosporobacter subterraneus]SHI78730.1 Predicted Zn-dependent peptidase [Geosporobacter subterraneus DSM 17957]
MFQKYTLSNGVRLVVEKIPYVKSVTLGFWIEAGSIHEDADSNGITHFVEHMLFKGTDTRSAREIAESFDSIGGQLNAFTSKECTCFYGKVLDTHLSIAIDVLTDMLFHSSFNPREIEKEKGVIIEEINMYEDSPEDLVHELLSNTVFKHHNLGMPVLGTAKTVTSFDRQKLLSFVENYYTMENMVISVAGNFDENSLIEQLEEKLNAISSKKRTQKPESRPSFSPDGVIRYKDIEQLHICLGLEGASLKSQDLYPLLIVNNVFGGSMSSRLFQNIREDKGLAYSVFSYPSSYKEIGLLTIYAGINPNQLDEVLKLINQEIHVLKKDGLTKDELHKSKEQLKGSYMLGLESTSSRMSAIGKSELLLNRTYSPKEIIEKIDQVTIQDVRRVIDRVFISDNSALAIVGKVEKDKNLSGFLDY